VGLFRRDVGHAVTKAMRWQRLWDLAGMGLLYEWDGGIGRPLVDLDAEGINSWKKISALTFRSHFASERLYR
jgi:hypothetical protein